MSLVLIFLFVIPIGETAFYAFQISNFGFFHHRDNVLLWRSLSPVLIYFVFLTLSIILHANKYYRENIIMAGTLVIASILFWVWNYISVILFNLIGIHH